MVEAELVAVASYLARYIEQKEQAFQVLMLAKHAADGNLSLALEIASEEMEELASDDAGGSFQGAACGVGHNPGRDGCEKASGETGEAGEKRPEAALSPGVEQTVRTALSTGDVAKLDKFRAFADRKGIDADAAIERLRGEGSKVVPSEVSREEAIGAIRAGVPDNTLEAWFRKEDKAAKPRLFSILHNDAGVRNAALNLFHQEYQRGTGDSVSFDDFLSSEVTLYRGGGKPDPTKMDVFFSYSFDRAMSEKFGEVEEIQVRPIDTLGMLSTTAEGEVLVPTRPLQGKTND